MTNRKVFVGGIIISLLAIVYLLSYPKAIPVAAATQQRPVVVYEAMKRPAPVRRPIRPIRLPPPSPKPLPPVPPPPTPAHVMLTQTSEARPFPDEAPPLRIESQPMPAPSFVEPTPTPPLALSSLAQAYTPSVLPRRARALPMSRKSFRSQPPQSFTPPPAVPPPHEAAAGADRRPVTLIKDL